MMIFIYTVIFSRVMKSRLGSESGLAYSLYLCSGVLAWNFFSEIVNRGAVTLLDNAAFLKKMPIPPIVLFGATCASAAINFLISFSLFLVVLLAVKPVGIGKIGLFFGAVSMLGLFGLGLGVAIGCLNVFLRDFQQVTAIVFQLWFWFTPVVYLHDALPELARKALLLNPAFPFIKSFHDLLYFDQYPSLRVWAAMIVTVVISISIGAFVYKKSIATVRDQL